MAVVNERELEGPVLLTSTEVAAFVPNGGRAHRVEVALAIEQREMPGRIRAGRVAGHSRDALEAFGIRVAAPDAALHVTVGDAPEFADVDPQAVGVETVTRVIEELQAWVPDGARRGGVAAPLDMLLEEFAFRWNHRPDDEMAYRLLLGPNPGA